MPEGTAKLRPFDTTVGSLAEEAARIVLLTSLGIAGAAAVVYQVLAISYRYPLGYGEAPLVDQAMRLAAGENIYRADLSTPPYVIANYAPLYVSALTPFVKLLGPSFFAGRAIAVLCAWLSAILLARIVVTQTGDRLAGVVSGLLFIAFPFVAGWSLFARVDLMALMLSVGALCSIARTPLTRGHVVAAALLLTAAIYTKQSYALAGPLAVFVWLWVHYRRWAFRMAAMVGGLSLALLLLLNTLTDGGFYFNTVTANINDFDNDWLMHNLRRFTSPALILVCFGAASLVLRRASTHWPMTASYLVGAALSTMTVGKVGSDVNYFLELCAALSLAAGSVVAWSRRQIELRTVRAAVFALLAIQAVVFIQATAKSYGAALKWRLDTVNEMEQLEAIVMATEGAILADADMGLLTLQGRPLMLQPFEMTQLAQAGLWDQSRLVQRIRNKEFPLVLIHLRAESTVYKERWTAEMLAAIEDSYSRTQVLARTSVYRPIGYVPE